MKQNINHIAPDHLIPGCSTSTKTQPQVRSASERGAIQLESAITVATIAVLAISAILLFGRAINKKNCESILQIKYSGEPWVQSAIRYGLIGYRVNEETGRQQCCNTHRDCSSPQQDEFYVR